jgi:hypothetical protein
MRGTKECRVLVLIGKAYGRLDARVRGPHQAVLLFHQLQHVVRAADPIDGAVAIDLLGERLVSRTFERPIDWLWKKADPMSAELNVWFFTG